jgi:PAS domain S-box-containing protein
MDGRSTTTHSSWPESREDRLRRRAATADGRTDVLSTGFIVSLVSVFLAYFIAGKLGQATSNIRSSNLGPVWPAYGVAVAAFLAYGYRIWPAVAASAFLVATQGSVSAVAAAGQATGATLGAASGMYLLRSIPGFDPSLSRLRDALGLIVFGAFGSALVSSVIGVTSLYATGIQAYSGLPSAWLIYWLGDSTGVLLMTPLVFTLPGLLRLPWRALVELAALLTLLSVACSIVFGDWALLPVHFHVLAFVVLPFVMWGAINFGTGGAALTVFLIASVASVLTAFGFGPFASGTPFVNALLLDVLFTVLSITGLSLAAVIAERERAEREHEALIREQAAMESRLQLAAIVESSEDAIWSQDLDGVILSWNAAAERIFGFTEQEAIGQPVTMIVPPERRDIERRILDRVMAGDRIVHDETTKMTKAGTRITVSLTASPLKDASGTLIGVAKIARDLSEQERARDALSAVNRKLISAQEEERARIARELHDDISQRLALLASDLSSTAIDSRHGSTRLRTEISQIASDVQALSHNLHSSKLELLGIAVAARFFCADFAEQQKVSVAFETHDVPAHVASDSALCLYRILQEALHNAVKHSGVRHFAVRLLGTREEIRLTISDDGTGFDLKAATASRGIGLVSMQERVALVGGDLVIESAPGHGTTIHARVPVRPSAPAG